MLSHIGSKAKYVDVWHYGLLSSILW